MLSQMSLNEVSVVSSGVSVVLSLSTLSSPSAQLVLLTMMTQVEVSWGQDMSTSVWPAPVWCISASFLAVTVWGREEQEEWPDTRYISGTHPPLDREDQLELEKLHTAEQVLTISPHVVELMTYQNWLLTPPQWEPLGRWSLHCLESLPLLHWSWKKTMYWWRHIWHLLQCSSPLQSQGTLLQ